jgi:hypothetical protein
MDIDTRIIHKLKWYSQLVLCQTERDGSRPDQVSEVAVETDGNDGEETFLSAIPDLVGANVLLTASQPRRAPYSSHADVDGEDK